MDLSRSGTEALIELVHFHDEFNSNIKLTFGSLAYVNANNVLIASPQAGQALPLPNGGEPWGRNMRWNNMPASFQKAATFISELGIASANSSFQDFLIRLKADIDRNLGFQGIATASASVTIIADEEDDDRSKVEQILALCGAQIPSEITTMRSFFSIARNCIVHRSNKASARLEELSRSQEFRDALATWPKRVGKWSVDVPIIQQGHKIEWLPRHAILASDVYYRCGVAIDRQVVELLGTGGMTRLAAFWCLLADQPVECGAKRDAETMVRNQLINRYRARNVDVRDMMIELRQFGFWERVRQAYLLMHPPSATPTKKKKAR